VLALTGVRPRRPSKWKDLRPSITDAPDVRACPPRHTARSSPLETEMPRWAQQWTAHEDERAMNRRSLPATPTRRMPSLDGEDV